MMASKTLLVGDGQIVGDGSWVLNILVTDLNLERKFRVRGDMHIGGVMLRLVEDLGEANLHSIFCFSAASGLVTSPSPQ